MLYNYLHFSVEAGDVKVISMHQHQCRGDNALAILKELVSRIPARLEGRSGVIYFGDFPPNSCMGGVDLSFCTTHWLGGENPHLPFPCPYSLKWPEVGIEDGERLTIALLNDTSPPQDGRLFWIGADNHYSRVLLVKLAKVHPGYLDASMMEWEASPGVVRQKVYSGRYVTIPDHRRYKYLIDCPGTGYSARLRWLLATGRPVFIVERGPVEWWHLRLRAWVHYIPVRSDLSDLMDGLRRLEEDPHLYQAISENAKSFVANNLLPGREIDALVGCKFF
jgi:hypothetical protein